MKLTIEQIAKEYALYTRVPLFLTGRAGTGKTTWLKSILQETDKKHVVVAPTGVAAINAGGVTIHSMFQLPLTSFIPTNDEVDPSIFTNRNTLAKTQKVKKERIELILELELLIIDEISMVRADLLDAIDAVLRRYRKNPEPFGGVQVIVIGDLFQLSPVLSNQTFRILSNYYDSPYFFDSWVWKQSKPVILELTTIYRQSDEEFINILNGIRVGNSTAADLTKLNTRVVSAPTNHHIITLSTHNYKVNSVNQQQLKALKTKTHTLSAEITGKFSKSAYPADEEIIIKEGCQVMFVRNHPDGLYYNGKIGIVTGKLENDFLVKCQDDSHALTVSPVEWKSINYSVDKETKEVITEEIGSFTQYPLKLAWAVTVHKSQGLTFDEACLDVADTFAPGQLYVALSRCRSMEGLFLTAPITQQNIIVDQKIRSYYEEISNFQFDEKHLALSKAEYEDKKILESWTFNKLLAFIEIWNDVIENGNLPDEDSVFKLAHEINSKLIQLEKTSKKFQSQLSLLIAQYKEDDSTLDNILQRCHQAIDYFTEALHDEVIVPLEEHHKLYKLKSKIKKYREVVSTLIDDMWLKVNQLYSLQYRSIDLFKDTPKYKRVKLFDPDRKSTKAKKGETYNITLSLLNENKSIEEIASIRSLAFGTIESHLNRLLKDSKINLDQIMTTDRQDKLISYFIKNEGKSITDIKNIIPIATTYGELRWIQTHLNKSAGKED